jgi:hypothetical protein
MATPIPPPPSTAQVISAAIQNVVVAGLVAAGWYLGKIDSVVAIPSLMFIIGVDFVGRKRLPGSSTLVASLGSVGALEVVARAPWIAAVLAALGVASG